MKVAIIGEGAWGTALATVCAQTAESVKIWSHDTAIAHEINTRHTNSPYFSSLVLSERISASVDINETIADVECIIIAIPVRYVREVVSQMRSDAQQLIIIGCKGIEQNTAQLPSQILKELLPHARLAVLSGPSFAHGIAQQHLTGLTFAVEHVDDVSTIKLLMNVPFVVMQESDDLIGVQVCGAFKNIIALAVGLLDGLGASDNTKILCIMQFLEELKALLVYYQADTHVIDTFAGIGDVMLTCLGSKSKNCAAGICYAQGKTLSEIEAQCGTLPESFNTLQAVQLIAQKNNLKLTKLLAEIIFSTTQPQKLLDGLSSR